TLDNAISEKYLELLKHQDNNIRNIMLKQQATSQEPWDQNHFEELLAKWVAACDQPFTAVTEQEFWDLLQYTHHHAGTALHIPGEKAIQWHIMQMGQDLAAKMKEMFKENKSNFSLSLDAWTSSNGYTFIALVIHYIGNDGKLEECLIDFLELIGEHSGENMCKVVWNAVEKYGLLGWIVAFVMDNATNNDTLVEAFAQRCHEASVDFSVCDACMRCLPHTVHLAALQFLQSVGALSKDENDNA
ncbi:restless-like transposase, partial [Moniliophthora roreri MCA 2997]